MRVTKPRKSFYIRRYWLCSGGFEEFGIRASHDDWRVTCQSVLDLTGANVRCGIVEKHPTEFVLESVIFEH